ncbi:TPA: hypothetical protein DCW54_01770, partial [Candidatus Dependentiae bacterium]|nr:hypothetical protein [Candidatus Dependentiae bacterium]
NNLFFCSKIFIHGWIKLTMLLAKVGKNCRIKNHAGKTLHRKGLCRSLTNNPFDILAHALCKKRMQIIRQRRGHTGRRQRHTINTIVYRAH